MDKLFSYQYMRTIVATLGILLIIVIGAMIAQQFNLWQVDPHYATINVEGVAEVTAVPDLGHFSFTVEAEAAEVGVAQEESAKKINDIMGYLKGEGGVAEADIKIKCLLTLN